MEFIGVQIRSSKTGTTGTGIGPDSNYGLAECYGDLSAEDCILCYAESRTVLPSCFPNTGGQIFLDGCFMRTENYSFYEEYAGPDDTVICGNRTRYGVSLDSARQAISDAARDAPRNRDYFARKEALSGTANESTYVLADCWGTLNESSCAKCLERASASILQCLPWSEGRALHTGCFMRYSNTNFLNAEPTGGDNGDVRVTESKCFSTRKICSYSLESSIVSQDGESRFCRGMARAILSFGESVLGIILGSGAGTRLYPLTKKRAKPAVPLGENCSLIDIHVSNYLNSNISKIYVLTQFNSASLNRQLSRAYASNMGGYKNEGFVEVLAAQQSPENPNWFRVIKRVQLML
ncbi:hypothetical protein L2E82_12641 [Cichorium intybus]|uniref:Uncharacterized protein n=1 Tax=Cichorium intybus TaxID=13427 RepID=A0ACB9GHN9_CICIN|nr:hypothetical protein L2E82_12641 [Cichorium intybus]